MTVIVKTNLPDFKRQMQELGNGFVGIARSATSAAAAEFAKDVRKIARGMNRSGRGTGRLARAVIIKRARRVPRGTVMYIVGIRQGKSAQRVKRGNKVANLDAFYWRFLEQGWVPRGPGKRLSGAAHKKRELRRSSAKSRIQYQFLEPAFLSADGRALRTFYERMERGTSQAIAQKIRQAP